MAALPERRSTVGKVGDEGLDGVIRQGLLGLDRIYVQAKRCGACKAVRWLEIPAFVGALHGAQADRGIFIYYQPPHARGHRVRRPGGS
jgi:restriction system protein